VAPPTNAELEILRRLVEPGATIVTAAQAAGISHSAAKARLRSLYRKLGVTNAVQAYAKLSPRLHLAKR
jgi:DNA-binding CsgD family transcriptional regulator